MDVAIKYNDTLAVFKQTGGIEVMVDKGLITVVAVPFQDPQQVFVACGSATAMDQATEQATEHRSCSLSVQCRPSTGARSC